MAAAMPAAALAAAALAAAAWNVAATVNTAGNTKKHRGEHQVSATVRTVPTDYAVEQMSSNAVFELENVHHPPHLPLYGGPLSSNAAELPHLLLCTAEMCGCIDTASTSALVQKHRGPLWLGHLLACASLGSVLQQLVAIMSRQLCLHAAFLVCFLPAVCGAGL
jgi:hypothetical protein